MRKQNNKQYSQTDLITGHTHGVMARPYGFVYDIYIDEELVDPSEWRAELQAIREAGPEDVINLRINSPGGSDLVMGAFCKAIAESPARVVGHIEHMCCSAVTVIFLACHEYVVSDDCEFMIHTASMRYGGKQNNFHQYSEFVNKTNEKLMKKYYEGFLTEEEIQQALEGKDFWFDAQGVVERLQNRGEALQESCDCFSYSKAKDMSHSELLEYLFPMEFEQDLSEDSNTMEESEEVEEDKPIPEGWVFDEEYTCLDYNGVSVFDDGFIIINSADFGVPFLKTPDSEYLEDYKSLAKELDIKYPKNYSTKKIAQLCLEKIKPALDFFDIEV